MKAQRLISPQSDPGIALAMTFFKVIAALRAMTADFPAPALPTTVNGVLLRPSLMYV